MERRKKYEVRMHFIMAVCGGFFGGYAIFGRMAVFGSAQTANLIELMGDILGRNAGEALLRILALAIYVGAMIIFSILAKKTAVNLRYLAILLEMLTAALIGFFPKEMNPIVALYPVFFATSFQWCVFKGADGYACSTIFSTNNVKQTVLSFTDYFLTEKKKEKEREQDLKKGKFFGGTLLCFHAGVAIAYIALQLFGLRSAWACILLLMVGLWMTEMEEGVLRTWMAKITRAVFPA